MRQPLLRRFRQSVLHGLRRDQVRSTELLQGGRGVPLVLVAEVGERNLDDPGMLLAHDPPRADHQPADGQVRLRNAGHLGDARLEHYGLPLRFGPVQRKGINWR